ncbi:TetR/AcrR family transcriptional regulator [Nannocystis exedens]|uniref:TetR/AcrR family transcriptional regulator n=1 Tax=Nannocystis exedens TaxID=54 RepID=UPI000BCAB664|nr:TetR/AcrR family transcriptional regulator [Nannocystis exedens]PCC67102.1 TetR family transcriptional regulator [Nannocystis exedens]
MNGPRGNGETREAILDATDRLLTTRGFRSVTMDDIAGEAGVSRRTIYMYFPSKEEVGLSSIDRVVAQTYARLVALANAGGDPAEVLRAVLIERVLRRLDSVSAYRQSLDELFEAVRPAYMARRTAHMAREVGLVAAVLAAGAACGRFALDDEAAATASTLVKATNAFLPYSLSVHELGERAKVEVEVRRMADLLLKSLVVPAVARERAASGRSAGRGAAAPTKQSAGMQAAELVTKRRAAKQAAELATKRGAKRTAAKQAAELTTKGAAKRTAARQPAAFMTKAAVKQAAASLTGSPAKPRAATKRPRATGTTRARTRRARQSANLKRG